MIVGGAPGGGAKRDDRSRADVQAQKPFAHLARKIGATSAVPRGSADLSQWRPPIPNQTQWDGCTSMAAADLTNAMYASRGKALPFRISQLGLWSDALMNEMTPGFTAAQLAANNSGVQSADICIAVGRGIRAQGPCAPGTYCDILTGPVAPGLDQMTAAAMKPVVGEYRLDEVAADWTNDACVSLDNGIMVYVAMNVGPAYQAWTPNMPPIDADEAPNTGSGHAMRIDAYETTSTGEVIFTLPGSWGTGFADSGVWRMTAHGVLVRTFDCYPWEIQ